MSNERRSSTRGLEGSVVGDLARRATRLFTRTSRFDPLRSDGPDAQAEKAWRPCIKRRTLILLGLLALWTAGIEARLIWLQVIRHDDLVQRAIDQQEDRIPLDAIRGDIVDRYGKLLAYSVAADSIAATPSAISAEAKASTAKALCEALRDCNAKSRAELLADLSRPRSSYRRLRPSRSLSPEQVRRVAELKLPGIYLESDTRRYYPRRELASHVLGFVGASNGGAAGVELKLDKELRGERGSAIVQVDSRKQRVGTLVQVAPISGASLELTLDATMQFIAERELKAGIEAHRAVGGSVVVMESSTGALRAMANYPTFNPNNPGGSDDRTVNRAVQSVYEPGSTFKIVTASAALEENIVGPTDMIDTRPGSITFPGRVINDAGHNYGVLSFEDVIVKSSNVGAVKIGQMVGRNLLTRYVERFGFGQRTTPDLPGGIPGLWNPVGLNDSGLASVSMGYQIGVTPIQMVTAVNAVANGGILLEPHIVGAYLRNGRREPVAPKELRRVISPATAATLTTMMEGVVQRGTATAATIDGYQVAGKTGTARKAVNGSYSTTDYFASFVGFVPSRKPMFTILVVIDTPRAGTIYGGLVAAPIFKAIAAAVLQHEGVPSSINPVPPVIIRSQPELPSRRRTTTPMVVQAGGVALMPDVRGLAAREATRALSAAGLNVAGIYGSGFVVRQSPDPGTPVPASGQGWIFLGRRPAEAELAGGGAW